MGGIRHTACIGTGIFPGCHMQEQGFCSFHPKAVTYRHRTGRQINQRDILCCRHRAANIPILLKIPHKRNCPVVQRGIAVSGHRGHQHRRGTPLEGAVHIVLDPSAELLRGGVYIALRPAVGGIIVSPLHEQIVSRPDILQQVIQFPLYHERFGRAASYGTVFHNGIRCLIASGLAVSTVRSRTLYHLAAEKHGKGFTPACLGIIIILIGLNSRVGSQIDGRLPSTLIGGKSCDLNPGHIDLLQGRCFHRRCTVLRQELQAQHFIHKTYVKRNCLGSTWCNLDAGYPGNVLCLHICNICCRRRIHQGHFHPVICAGKLHIKRRCVLICICKSITGQSIGLCPDLAGNGQVACPILHIGRTRLVPADLAGTEYIAHYSFRGILVFHIPETDSKCICIWILIDICLCHISAKSQII